MKDLGELINIFENFQNFEFGAVIPKVQRFLNLVDLEKMLKNEYLVAKISVDTAENEPL